MLVTSFTNGRRSFLSLMPALVIMFSCVNLMAQQAPRTPGEPVQFKLSELAAHQGNVMTLQDGSSWQANMQHFGLSGTPVLLYGRNLRAGSVDLAINGFTLNASYKDGPVAAQQGFKLTLLSVAADGKRLQLTDNMSAQVVDHDRRLSRNWQSSKAVLLSEDMRYLIYLPNLQRVAVQISQNASP